MSMIGHKFKLLQTATIYARMLLILLLMVLGIKYHKILDLLKGRKNKKFSKTIFFAYSIKADIMKNSENLH